MSITRGTTIEYKRTDPWGEKSWTEKGKVVAIFGNRILLDTGVEFHKAQFIHK